MDTGQEGRRPLLLEAPCEPASRVGVFRPHIADVFPTEPPLGASPSKHLKPHGLFCPRLASGVRGGGASSKEHSAQDSLCPASWKVVRAGGYGVAAGSRRVAIWGSKEA